MPDVTAPGISTWATSEWVLFNYHFGEGSGATNRCGAIPRAWWNYRDFRVALISLMTTNGLHPGWVLAGEFELEPVSLIEDILIWHSQSDAAEPIWAMECEG